MAIVPSLRRLCIKKHAPNNRQPIASLFYSFTPPRRQSTLCPGGVSRPVVVHRPLLKRTRQARGCACELRRAKNEGGHPGLGFSIALPLALNWDQLLTNHQFDPSQPCVTAQNKIRCCRTFNITQRITNENRVTDVLTVTVYKKRRVEERNARPLHARVSR